MHRKAAAWVAAAPPFTGKAAQQPLRYAPGPPCAQGLRPVKAICTKLIGPTFFSDAAADGIVLYEPFGGLCAGLEMVLRGGIPVKRYLYSDTSTASRRVAAHRVAELVARYPSLITLDAAQDMLSLPQDVRHVGTPELLAAGALDGSQWMVVAGWPCQDLSAAGGRAGLRGNRSSTFYDLTRILGTLQQLQPDKPPA